MTDGSAVDGEGPSSDVDTLADALTVAAVAFVVAAGLQLAAGVAVAITMDVPHLDTFRLRLLQLAQGANVFTAAPLLIAVVLVAIFDHSIEDGGTRLPRNWRASVLWAVALLGVLVVLLNIADVVNIETASFSANAGSRVGRIVSDLAPVTLASAASWLAWRRLRPQASVARATSGEQRVEDYLS